MAAAAAASLTLLLSLLVVCTCRVGGGGVLSLCIGAEREALLGFKRSLEDPSNSLASWRGDTCCSWAGVTCSNATGNVVGLRLDDRSLGGGVSSSLLRITRLRSLNLSMNDFSGGAIPGFIGSFKELVQLDLSNSNFGGDIPHQLGNLSALGYLNLGSDVVVPSPGLTADTLRWITGLSSLAFLNLNSVVLPGDWLVSINRVATSLVELHLSACGLNSLRSPASVFFNLTSLQILDLSSNSITSPLPAWLLNITTIRALDLSINSIAGSIPDSFAGMESLAVLNMRVNLIEGAIPPTMGFLCSLRSVDFSYNSIASGVTEFIETLSRCPQRNLTILNVAHNLITGIIPVSIGKFSSLRELYLQANNMSGTVPEILGQMSTLVIVDVSDNSFVGNISEAHFTRLVHLKELYMSRNSFIFNVSSRWVPPFQLSIIYLPSCNLGPHFPQWLRSQTNYTKLDVNGNGISGALPDWFWNLTSNILFLNMSLNNIQATLPSSLESVAIQVLDLSFNVFKGSLPRLNQAIVVLNLYGNLLSGALPEDMGTMMPMMRNLLLSNNRFTGSIPASICEMGILQVLDLADNSFSGELPACWNETQMLTIMDLGDNKIFGGIPDSLGSVPSLKSLHLNNNSLTGTLPPSLKGCTSLVALDLGENDLSGEIPAWIGDTLSDLKILRLRSNRFTGIIPVEISYLASLQILDLAYNNLSGRIPTTLGNLTAMKVQQSSGDLLYSVWGSYEDTVLVFIKGRELEFTSTLTMLTSIDLSSNALAGEIPPGMTSLAGLYILNLSRNHLDGEIPHNIGKLRTLESLDLSRNLLSGGIPPSMSALSFLGQLNLSYNNLEGRIPSGSQLQTLGFDDPYIYAGNDLLCGEPLPRVCSGGAVPVPAVGVSGNDWDEDEDDEERAWFYGGLAPGFAVGIVVIWGLLVVKQNWRVAYFRMTNDAADWIFSTVAESLTKITSKLHTASQPWTETSTAS